MALGMNFWPSIVFPTWQTAKTLRPTEIDTAVDLTADYRAIFFAPRT